MKTEDIDRLRGENGTLDREAILSILPYGNEFLFVNSVEILKPSQIESTFPIPETAVYLDGHFRGLPIVPGAILSEAFAQAGSLLVRYNLDTPEPIDILGHHVESARFLGPVLPGDHLQLRVHLRNLNRRAARLEGEARVGDRLVGRMKMVVAIVTRESLREQLESLLEGREKSD